MRRPPTLQEAFDDRVRKSKEGCWEWLGFRGHNGYGVLQYQRVQQKAHRVACELYKGPIPDGLTIDHLCRNRGCVNPEHLEAVTIGVNTLRGDTITARNKAKTHCSKGHEFSAENTRLDTLGRRVCKTCQRDYVRKDRPLKNRDLVCRNGHVRTPENTQITKRGKTCKDCNRAKYLKPGGYLDPNRQRATECRHGHPYTPENTYEYVRDGRTYRYCRECNRQAARAS